MLKWCTYLSCLIVQLISDEPLAKPGDAKTKALEHGASFIVHAEHLTDACLARHVRL